MQIATHTPARFARALAPAAFAAVAFSLLPNGGAAAYNFVPLYSFCSAAACTDGSDAEAGLLLDRSGNLYGTTVGGGSHNGGSGVVFRLVPSTYQYDVLYDFCAKASCVDGAAPRSQLIMDIEGNLYGTASGGGRFGKGVAFKLTHSAAGWSLRVLHHFCAVSGCRDGSMPFAGLTYAGQASGALWDKTSPLFGTTTAGGKYNKGVAYELTYNGTGWKETVLRHFSTSSVPNPLLMDGSGNLLGTSQLGGKYGDGVMFRLAQGTWANTTLRNFCAASNCTDGWQPGGRLLMDGVGNLFGTATLGGANGINAGGYGVVFERTSGGQYHVLYNFCAAAFCSDGEAPFAGLIADNSGSLFGTTYGGGTMGGGVVFKLFSTPASGWMESVLYRFCGQTYLDNCTDGSGSLAPLVMDSAGDLFGTTSGGGQNGNYGTVFELTP